MEILRRELALSAQQSEIFEQLWQFYEGEFQFHNFTAIRDKHPFEIKHFLDSILPIIKFVPDFSPQHQVIDLGTGGGFPGIPLAIYYPENNFTLVDSLGKRIQLLERLKEKFKLKNVRIIQARIEDLAHDSAHRAKYDFVVNRAFVKWAALIELSVPYLKEQGRLLAFQGPAADQEAFCSVDALEELGAGLEQVHSYDLPENFGQRQLIEVKKYFASPKPFPRNFASIKKAPLYISDLEEN